MFRHLVLVNDPKNQMEVSCWKRKTIKILQIWEWFSNYEENTGYFRYKHKSKCHSQGQVFWALQTTGLHNSSANKDSRSKMTSRLLSPVVLPRKSNSVLSWKKSSFWSVNILEYRHSRLKFGQQFCQFLFHERASCQVNPSVNDSYYLVNIDQLRRFAHLRKIFNVKQSVYWMRFISLRKGKSL